MFLAVTVILCFHNTLHSFSEVAFYHISDTERISL